jgi:cell wall-associated NlpC family hydrolase
VFGYPVAALALGGIVSAAAGYFWASRRGANSEKEDVAPMSDGRLDATGELSDALGWPYFFGKGAPSTRWDAGADGVDCSGFAQMALVRLGLLRPDYTDRGAAALADDSDPVELGRQVPGDLAYYPGHVMVVVGYPGASGHSPVMGASGGRSTTLGNDPSARVKLFDSGAYRSDFVTYMRLKAGKA